MDRRHFLVATSAAVTLPLLPACAGKSPGDDTGAGPTPTRAPEPAPWAAPGTEDASTFAWGVQAGDPDDGSVLLSFRTTAAAVEVVVMEGGGDGWIEVHREAVTVTGETSQVRVDGLQADTVYAWAVYDGADRRSRVGRFRTALAADGYRVVTLGASSCLGDADQPWPTLTHAAGRALDGFLLLGDTIYGDGAYTLEEYHAFWREAFGRKGLADVSASTGLVATWDDHELDDNWTETGVPAEQYEAALTAFREWVPQRVGPTGGIWRSIRWGTVVELFVLDCRSEREGETYIGADQMDWLKAGLAASPCRFKLILNSVPICDYTAIFGTVEAEDRWQGFGAQRAEILSWIADGGISGVLWVAGDVHHAMLNHPDPPGTGPGGEQWEVACGPAGSTPNAIVEAFTDTTGQFPILFADWNWTELVLDPGAGTISITFYGDDGGVLASQVIEP